eukprot:scaffold56980_cov97-Phaeocystis_antarctica.AAC.3
MCPGGDRAMCARIRKVDANYLRQIFPLGCRPATRRGWGAKMTGRNAKKDRPPARKYLRGGCLRSCGESCSSESLFYRIQAKSLTLT